MKKVNTALLIRLCLPQFAVGLFTTMLNNLLMCDKEVVEV